MAKIPTEDKNSKISTIVFDRFPHFDFSRRKSFFFPVQLPDHLKNASEYVMKEAEDKMEEYCPSPRTSRHLGLDF